MKECSQEGDPMKASQRRELEKTALEVRKDIVRMTGVSRAGVAISYSVMRLWENRVMACLIKKPNRERGGRR